MTSVQLLLDPVIEVGATFACCFDKADKRVLAVSLGVRRLASLSRRFERSHAMCFLTPCLDVVAVLPSSRILEKV